MTGALPALDVVIAAHDPRRRVDRAVRSVVEGASAAVRVTVVAHGLPAARVEEALGTLAGNPDVRVVEHHDGVRSPAGPFTRGIELAEADFVAVLGSDDFLEPGAVDAWLAHATARSTDYLMAPLRDQAGAVWRDPLVRPRRRHDLDPVRDRLAYRAAPLGLLRRSYLERLGVPLTPGLATGEDIEIGLALVNGGGRVDHDPALPAYVIGQDAPERVTFAVRPFAAEAAALLHLTSVPWVRELPPARRRALAIKLWRLNVVPAVLLRPDADAWDAKDLSALRDVARWLDEIAPDADRSLSRAEGAVVSAARTPTADGVARAVAQVRRARTLDRVLTTSPVYVLARDSMLRRSLRLRLPR